MTQRAARFLVKPTKEVRFAQTNRESRAKVKRFHIRNQHTDNRQHTEKWLANLLKETV